MKLLASLVLPCLAGASALNGLPDAEPDTNPGGKVCDCKGAASTNATDYLCGDKRLGPKQLPTKLPLGSFVASYNRLGSDDVSVEEFLGAWTGPDGRYRYPPQNGFTLDVNGDAVNGTLQLEVGTLLDRFGSEYGIYKPPSLSPLFLFLSFFLFLLKHGKPFAL